MSRESPNPGVTDPVGNTSVSAIGDMLGKEPGNGRSVYYSRQYLLRGIPGRAYAERIARDLLANDIIEDTRIIGPDNYAARGLEPLSKRVVYAREPVVREYGLEVPDEELMRISSEGLLSMNLEEMKAIASYFKAPDVIEERRRYGLSAMPTDAELEAIAQTWSDHCKHKNFNARVTYTDEKGKKRVIDSLYETFIKGSTKRIRRMLGEDDFLLSVFEDNAGVVKFNDDYSFVLKVETHNAPSALDPYGGAITGIVGVNRDPFGTGKGARLIFNTDVFAFGPTDYDKELPYKNKGEKILHPKRVFGGVRKGVEDGGNQSGIPTISGGIYFNDKFLGKPLVHVGTGALMPAYINGEPSHVKEIIKGDLIVMCGGRIGKDGIHGATFSSEGLHKGSPTSAVQIGDPITQKIMNDFLLEARDRGYYRTLTDNGAGGLSSSVGELARLSGGLEVDLRKAPLKYAGLDPWEILISEAQERMTLAVKPEYLDEFMELAQRRGVESTVLGRFNDSGRFHVRYGDNTVAYLDMEFLHGGVPQWELDAEWKPPVHEEPDFGCPEDLTGTLHEMLSRWNICSRESVIRQYDHEVQGGTVVKPLVGEMNDGPGDAAVVKPLSDSYEGIAVTHGYNPNYSEIDTYHMAACSIDEAVRSIIAAGGRPDRIVFCDNFCWPDTVHDDESNPDGKYKEAQLVRANQALQRYCTGFRAPCVSGKDSMHIDFKVTDSDGNPVEKISGQPSLLMTAAAKVDDVRKCVTMDVKMPGDLVYVLGKTYGELGASEYYAMHSATGNRVPRVRLGKARSLYQSLSRVMQEELVASCHDCSQGGLGVALAESSFSGGCGIEVDLRKVPRWGIGKRDDYALFSESQSRFVVTIAPDYRDEFESMMEGNEYAMIGRVTNDKTLSIRGLSGREVVREDIYALKESWQRPMR